MEEHETTIEPESVLVEVRLHVVGAHGVVVRARQPALHVREDAVHVVHRVSTSRALRH